MSKKQPTTTSINSCDAKQMRLTGYQGHAFKERQCFLETEPWHCLSWAAYSTSGASE